MRYIILPFGLALFSGSAIADGEGTAAIEPGPYALAGSRGTWTITYRPGPEGVKPGGGVRLPLSGFPIRLFARPQCDDPDAPNYTPRISAMLDLREQPGSLTLSILKANVANPELTDRFTYRPATLPPGLGMGLTTYLGDGTPLPSFQGDPLLLPCTGSAQIVLDSYWDALDVNNRVALAVKRIPIHGGSSEIILRNRFGNR